MPGPGGVGIAMGTLKPFGSMAEGWVQRGAQAQEIGAGIAGGNR